MKQFYDLHKQRRTSVRRLSISVWLLVIYNACHQVHFRLPAISFSSGSLKINRSFVLSFDKGTYIFKFLKNTGVFLNNSLTLSRRFLQVRVGQVQIILSKIKIPKFNKNTSPQCKLSPLILSLQRNQ